MSIGFFGIQFGWALQMANTSAIYEYLGASPEQIPILWLAAPLSGLIAQPIIGYMSDRTWTWLGRRRPYFLTGAILSSIALILMPNSSSLWMAAGLLWVLDTSINISMEPFRAFVADIVPEKQRTLGFAMQSLFIGLGAVVAALMPWLLERLWHFPTAPPQTIPIAVKLSFYVGAAVFLGTVLWTVLSTKEYPPKNLKAFERRIEKTGGMGNGIKAIFGLFQNMPETMKQLTGVQFFSWLGMFCMFLYFPPAVAHNIFGAMSESSVLYAEGIEWAGVCIAVYNALCFLVSWPIARIANRIGCQLTHALSLFCGGTSLIALLFIGDRYWLILPMIGFGIAWASILSMPYAILAKALPASKMGSYLGIFNAFIVIPQICVALGLGWIMHHFLHNDSLLAVVFGGGAMIIAAFWALGVNLDTAQQDDQQTFGQQLAQK
ncbi:MAG: MFS transporter [Jaaginema sp. PMC 1079.18]|nr:MFS transporter [Jaaginema sp. PMC 1080.18]MEC4849812.1 MFS transporter [Jaaginema sp. PMC 1079.18]MEC4866894.1 MFS transporter [Jaaginema sp. PMC 1078.18]